MTRGWRRKRDGQTPVDADASTVADQPLADLLDDVRDLRLTLAADLTAAAAAADLGCDHVVADIVDGDRRELAEFTRSALSRLRALDERPVPASGVPAGAVPAGAVAAGAVAAAAATPAASAPAQWRRRALITLPAIPLAGALAMSAAAAMGVLPGQHPSHSAHAVAQPSAPVTSTFEEFATVASGDPSASQLVAAASALHDQLAAMIASAPQDPSGVSEVAQLLQMEQALLLRKLPPGSNIVLAQSRRLAARLLSVTEKTSTPKISPVPTSTTHNASPKPATTATATPKPTSTSTSKTSPTPTATASPSPSSSSSPGHLPTIGN